MDLKEYMQMARSNADWLPGKDAIEKEILRCCDDTPHFIDMQEKTQRSMSLNGIFVYKDGSECVKLTTCGLTQIVPNEFALGQIRSGWGGELTAALYSADEEKVNICVKLLARLAQYVNVRKTMFMEYGSITLNRMKYRESVESDLAGIIFVRDMRLKTIETLHGSVEFLQIVGVNSDDWKKINRTPALVRQYIHEAKKCNPNLYLDRIEKPNMLE